MPPGRQSWLFQKDHLEMTPSRQDGMSAEEERAVRKSTCQFIQKVGQMTWPQCKPLSVNTAKVFFHRVCMTQSVARGRQNAKLLGVTCLFVACKTEEDIHPIREFIWAMNRIDVDQDGKPLYPYGENNNPTVDARGRKRERWMVDEESDGFQKVRENILQVERLILHVLDFDFLVRHPMTHVKDLIQFLDKRRKRNEDNSDYLETRRLVEGDGCVLTELGDQVLKTALAMANDSFSTTLSLQYDSVVIAAGCVWLAIKASTKSNMYRLVKLSKWSKELVTHLNDKIEYQTDPILQEIVHGLKKEHIEDVQNQMLDAYDEAAEHAQAAAAEKVLGSEHKDSTSAAAPAVAQPLQPTRPSATVGAEGHGSGGGQHTNGTLKPASHSSHGSSAPAGPTDRNQQDLADLEAGKVVYVKSRSAGTNYELKYDKEYNIYSCTCTVWRHVPVKKDAKTCRHLWGIRGRAVETGRVGEENMKSMEKAENDLRGRAAAQAQRPGPGGGGGGHAAGGMRPRADGVPGGRGMGEQDAAKRQRTGP